MHPSAFAAALPAVRHLNSTRATTGAPRLRHHRGLECRLALPALVGLLAATSELRAGDASPFATSVVSYAPGSGAVAGFTNPSTALGSPERVTGEPFSVECVTPFVPAWRPHEIVSIGTGGHLVVAFDQDVVDDPRNPFGIDLIVFGNAFFTDAAPPFGVVAGLVAEGGTIAVSPDGVRWTPVPGVAADGAFPTLGYLDVGPYAGAPGSIPSDFLRPIDPALEVNDLLGLDHASVVDAYAGSGGGTGIDLAALGLERIRFVRIDGPATQGWSAELDAFADVAPVAPDPDLDGSGAIDAIDLAMLLAAWGLAKDPADLDGSGLVDAADLAILLAGWSESGS